MKKEGRGLPFVLDKTKMLPSLKGVMWNHPTDKGPVISFPLQLDIKRSKVIVQIIQKESDPDSKFEVFPEVKYRWLVPFGTGGKKLFIDNDEQRTVYMVKNIS